MSFTIKDFYIGQKAKIQRVFREEDVRACMELTKDYSPIYMGEKEAWKKSFKQPIIPGLLTEGLITQVISEKLPGMACILLQKELIYYHPVYLEDTITAEVEIIDINVERNWLTQKVVCYGQNNQEVIKGQVVLLLLSN